MQMEFKCLQNVKPRFLSVAEPFCGILYGFRNDNQVVCINFTGKYLKNESDQDYEELVLLSSEMFPFGINPIGIVFVEHSLDLIKSKADSSIKKMQKMCAYKEASSIIVLHRCLSEGSMCFSSIEKSGTWLNMDRVIEINEKQLRDLTIYVRITAEFTLISALEERLITSAFQHIIDKVACPYGSFILRHSHVTYMHRWKSSPIKGNGWTGNDAIEAETEDCYITNVTDDIEEESIDKLWKYIEIPEKLDDSALSSSSLPKPMNFDLLLNMSGEACTPKTLNSAPILYDEEATKDLLQLPINVDTLGFAPISTKMKDLMFILKGAVLRQLHEIARCVLAEFKIKKSFSLPEVFHFNPLEFGHLVTLIYTQNGTTAGYANFRKFLHRTFVLPLNRTYFRRANAISFFKENSAVVNSGPLLNVHLGVKNPSGCSLVQGTYAYYHYGQDNFKDNGWGCAYRSLQTIISWFRCQAYTATEIPTHAEIQKCLVDIGDKDEDFIDSRQWIGSTEVGFVLSTACNVESRFISVSSGEELSSTGRELAFHFDTQGTPVMIGGGDRAHTIIGVSWDETSGDTKWLILDPHFDGPDWTKKGEQNTSLMYRQGWVGWKGPDFWVKGTFYNMCMPQRPNQW